MHKHYFRCSACGKHVVSYTEESLPLQPGSTHGKALENGGSPAMSNDTGSAGCLGALTYCSGVAATPPFAPCVPPHPGSVLLQPQPEPIADPNWTEFAQKVSNAWSAFVNSGYSPTLRGANNHREYTVKPSVRNRLQAGVVMIGKGVYTVSSSLHADVSLHRPIPAAHQVGNIRSFIFHL